MNQAKTAFIFILMVFLLSGCATMGADQDKSKSEMRPSPSKTDESNNDKSKKAVSIEGETSDYWQQAQWMTVSQASMQPPPEAFDPKEPVILFNAINVKKDTKPEGQTAGMAWPVYSLNMMQVPVSAEPVAAGWGGRIANKVLTSLPVKEFLKYIEQLFIGYSADQIEFWLQLTGEANVYVFSGEGQGGIKVVMKNTAKQQKKK